MQYLQDMGQAVTAALANFGIDASYEVRGDNKTEPSAEEKSKAAAGEQGQRSETETNKENVETAASEAQPTAPPTTPAPPATPAAPEFGSLENAEAEYCQAVEQAQEVKEVSEDHHEKAEDGQSHLVKAPSEKFRHLEEAEEEYCKAVGKESNEEKEVNTVKGINLPNEAIGLQRDCRCFVSRVGRWQCPACCKKAGRTARRPGGDFQHGRPGLVVKPRRRRLQISRALTNPAVNLARTPTSKHCLMKASRIAPTELLRMRKSENYR
ncbi:hypothetical protein OSTOST_16893 [Ostertagia ostertagi]